MEIPVLLMLNGDGKFMINSEVLQRSGYKTEPFLHFETKNSNPVRDWTCPKEIQCFFWDWWVMWSSLIKFYHPDLDIDSKRLLNPWTKEFTNLCSDDTTETYPPKFVEELEKSQTVAIPPVGASARTYRDNFLRVVNIHRAAKGRGKLLWDGKAIVEEITVAAEKSRSRRSPEKQVASQALSKKRVTGLSRGKDQIRRILQEIDDAGDLEELEKFLADRSLVSCKDKSSLDESRRIDENHEMVVDDEDEDSIKEEPDSDVDEEQLRDHKRKKMGCDDEDDGSPGGTNFLPLPTNLGGQGDSKGEIQEPTVFFELADGESHEDDEEFLPDVKTDDSIEEIHSMGEPNPAQLHSLQQEFTEEVENLKGKLDENMESLRKEVHESNRLLHQLLSNLGSVFRFPSSHPPTS